MSTAEPQATWSITTIDDLIRVIETQSDRINQILDSDGDPADLLDRLEHATLTALDDIRAAADLLKEEVEQDQP